MQPHNPLRGSLQSQQVNNFMQQPELNNANSSDMEISSPLLSENMYLNPTQRNGG